MRRVFASLLVIGLLPGHAAALEAAREAAAGTRTVGACSLLTRELVTKVTPYDKPALDLVMRIPPQEEAIGQSGSVCDFGGITLQIDPFTPDRLEKLRDETWVAIADVGDAAYFRDNRGEWAELAARSGRRVLTIQMDVPTGRTTASIQPNVIALAKAILPKLK